MTRQSKMNIPAGLLFTDRKTAGFTLVELMIALAIGVVLISGMISVFLGHKRTSVLNEAVVDMQQSARFALSVLSRDIRMAGFQGCADPIESPAKIFADTSPTTDIQATAISGHIVNGGVLEPEGPTGFTLPNAPATPVAGSHVLTVQFGSAETHRLQPMTSASDPIILETTRPGIVTGDLVLVSNCQVADLIQVSGAQQSALQHDASVNSGENELSTIFGNGGEINRPRVMRFESNVFFLADTGRLNGAGDTITSLYRQSLPYTSEPLEVIEGVENFQLRFALRGDDDNVRYATADELKDGDAADIIGVQIGLLMQSHDRVTDNPQTGSFWLAGSLVNPNVGAGANSRRLRMAFNSSVRVRNRR